MPSDISFDLILWGGAFILSLSILVISADYFIKSSEKIGLALGAPSFIVGVTIIALGTSLPELITNLLAILNKAPGTSEIVLGNVVGSNITNMCLVLGIVAITANRIDLSFDVMKVDLPILMGATFLLTISIWDQQISWFEELLFLGGMGIYVGYVFTLGKEENGGEENGEAAGPFNWQEVLYLVISASFIFLAGQFLIVSIKNIATLVDVGADIIAQTAVAFGTSVPELVVSIVAIRSNNAEMAIGNVMGSNIFNIFAVVGVPGLFGIIPVSESVFSFGIPMMVGTTFLAFFIIQDKVINRWEGWILLLFYFLYIGNLILG